MPVKVLNLNNIISQLKATPETYLKAADRGLEDTADAVLLGIQRFAPVDTGRLRGSYNVDRKPLRYSVGTNLAYAPAMEFGEPVGTGPHGGPRPHIRPSWRIETTPEKLTARVRRHIGRAV